MFISMKSCQTQTHILIDSSSINDDSDDEALKILFNLHPALAKDFLSHQEMRMHKITSPLTRSDRFLVDRFTISIHILPYPKYPVHVFIPCMGMIKI